MAIMGLTLGDWTDRVIPLGVVLTLVSRRLYASYGARIIGFTLFIAVILVVSVVAVVTVRSVGGGVTTLVTVGGVIRIVPAYLRIRISAVIWRLLVTTSYVTIT